MFQKLLCTLFGHRPTEPDVQLYTRTLHFFGAMVALQLFVKRTRCTRCHRVWEESTATADSSEVRALERIASAGEGASRG